jgi:hypothetical protein
MEHSQSWEASKSSANEAIPRRIYVRPEGSLERSRVPTLSHINEVHALSSYFFKIYPPLFDVNK